ncbi:unnamed protein product [Diabrotica balteata]|uniref:Transmembrane protein INAFM2 n=1 Tax=Diabrotica balteata TaxID=107213 RepID=A0A9P0E327_DIABA|nr:unnamed protein product [Diabrotica balteata]
MGTEDINTDTTDSRNSKDAFFDPKPKPKMIRVLTVLAYVLSVSMAAIFLSIYYIFMWNGEPHLGAHKSESLNYSSLGESDNGLNASLHIDTVPQALERKAVAEIVDDNRKINLTDFNIKEDLNNESSTITNTLTDRDLQQQFPAVEPEMRLPSPTTTSEDNTTNWQEDYNDSLEDLRKTSKLIKKLWDREEENY